MKKIARRSGFTLPEVLVTVTVVAVLAAVVVPAVTQYVNKGNAPASQSDISEIRNGVTGFIADTRVYPAYLTDLNGTSAPSYVSPSTLFKGPYLSGTVTSSSGGTAQGFDATGQADGTISFTSQGTGIAFADTIVNNTTAHELQLVVLFPYACYLVQHLDSLLDDGVATTGNLTFTKPSNCDSAHPTVNATTVRLNLVSTGSGS